MDWGLWQDSDSPIGAVATYWNGMLKGTGIRNMFVTDFCCLLMNVYSE